MVNKGRNIRILPLFLQDRFYLQSDCLDFVFPLQMQTDWNMKSNRETDKTPQQARSYWISPS